MSGPILKRKILLPLGAVGLVAILLLVRGLFFSSEKVPLITAPVTRMDIEESVLASGTLNALKTVAVGAQVSGQLKKLHVAVGDRVKKGQLLAEIDPVIKENAFRDAQASLESAVASRRAKQALHHQYELAFKRQQVLVAQDAGAKADLESAQATLESARAEIVALDASINKAKIAVDTAKADLEYTRISAPMDGVVLSITTEEGQTVVSTQSATTILTLANLDTITVKAQISEADVARVKPGMTVYFTTLGDSDTRHYSHLRAIEPGSTSTSSSTSTTSSTSTSAVYYNGLFEVPNTDKALRASMTAQVSIVLGEARKVLCIPVAALGDKDRTGWCMVKVLHGDRSEPRKVHIGINNRVHAQVLEGLNEGEQVVIGDTAVPVNTGNGMPPPPPRR
ncbi:MAG: efflux transporter, family, subunit [Holophagaceae bacterium]|nr:efflux transporter, family, subunit [Holophagaceae bacterium]